MPKREPDLRYKGDIAAELTAATHPIAPSPGETLMARSPITAPRSKRRQQDSDARARAAWSPVLYGREDDIAVVDGLLDRVRDGGAALLISGEPGIGKTALLGVAQDRAQSRGMRVLRLCGVTSEAHLPFGALHQAVGPMLKQAKSLPARQRSALQAAFGMSDATTAPDIFLIGLATLNLLAASAARRPVLLLADDGQWLDQPSHDVLAFISRRVNSDPIVLLMAIREGSDRCLSYSDGLQHRLSRLEQFGWACQCATRVVPVSPCMVKSC